jgi:hypothetical protein
LVIGRIGLSQIRGFFSRQQTAGSERKSDKKNGD